MKRPGTAPFRIWTIIVVALLTSNLLAPAFASAADSNDLILNASSVKFSTSTFLEGKAVRIYASVTNPTSTDLRGVVRFFDGQDQIQGDQPISVLASKDDSVFVDWLPTGAGEHAIRISASLFEKTDSNIANNSYTKTIQVQADTDRDGIANSVDPDDDNDKVPDTIDAFPLNKAESKDTDGDGIGDNKDDDDDNDGVKDAVDALPLDPKESVDTDHDGIGDNTDTDIDGDGLLNTEEATLATDPIKTDTDGDSINDKLDAFPLDASKAHDFDRDGIPDEQDQDADNDGTPKATDTNDTNLGPDVVITSEGQSPSHFAYPDESLQFESINSSDPDGKVSKTSWVVDGKAQDGNQVKTAFTTLGAHTVEAIVTDDKGETRTGSFQLYVLPSYLLWIVIPLILLIIILAIFITFSYSKPRRSRFTEVLETMEKVTKALPKAKRRKKKS